MFAAEADVDGVAAGAAEEAVADVASAVGAAS